MMTIIFLIWFRLRNFVSENMNGFFTHVLKISLGLSFIAFAAIPPILSIMTAIWVVEKLSLSIFGFQGSD